MYAWRLDSLDILCFNVACPLSLCMAHFIRSVSKHHFRAQRTTHSNKANMLLTYGVRFYRRQFAKKKLNELCVLFETFLIIAGSVLWHEVLCLLYVLIKLHTLRLFHVVLWSSSMFFQGANKYWFKHLMSCHTFCTCSTYIYARNARLQWLNSFSSQLLSAAFVWRTFCDVTCSNSRRQIVYSPFFEGLVTNSAAYS